MYISDFVLSVMFWGAAFYQFPSLLVIVQVTVVTTTSWSLFLRGTLRQQHHCLCLGLLGN